MKPKENIRRNIHFFLFMDEKIPGSINQVEIYNNENELRKPK